MNSKDYLRRVYRIDQRIALTEENVKELRHSATTLGSPGFEESYNPNHPTDAPYVKVMERLTEQEKKLEELIMLKQEIIDVINGLENIDERLVLTYRYLQRMSWRDIATEMFMDAKTVMKLHGEGLKNLVIS